MQTTQPYDDEISLLELWKILAKRKALIMACFVLCLAGGAAFAFLTSPVYEASVKLRIGQVQGNGGLLENAEELSSRILAQYGKDVATGITRSRPFITTANVQKGVTTTVQLTAEADTPEDAAHLLDDVVKGVQKAHAAMFEDNLKPIVDRLKGLDEQQTALQQQYSDITALVEHLKERDSVQASLVMIERGPITTAINALGSERLLLAQQVTPPQTRPTELIGEITAPAKPSKPKKALVLALAAVLGVMGGVVLAFVAEFISNAKARS
ncbi:Wzz/FepE/Etk N-terminal domain-containing protein [Thauera sp. 63]|uniref:Wzz/FepE/Etk N-terminal domain-containing protein n=1 Tax=Thauera sp. 63 TaxID=497321 RepID=UPI0002CFF8AA|nr:Wzz/FepE/Etk N-terminal domain-containing protein [Thauera sp. 63]ENO76175.1 lipopolysaccharide biosynthesis protein [Thauera sp. 63]